MTDIELKDGSEMEKQGAAELRKEDQREDGKMDRERIRLEMDSLSKNEEFARVVAAVFMSRLNPTLEEVDDVKTAVSEAVTNAVIHGYGGGEGKISMEISADAEKKMLYISIRDKGRGIPDVKKAMEPMFTTDPSGERSGMGFSIMEAFTDEMVVESGVGEGTTVILKKRFGCDGR